jgi:hypothetical protein
MKFELWNAYGTSLGEVEAEDTVALESLLQSGAWIESKRGGQIAYVRADWVAYVMQK